MVTQEGRVFSDLASDVRKHMRTQLETPRSETCCKNTERDLNGLQMLDPRRNRIPWVKESTKNDGGCDAQSSRCSFMVRAIFLPIS